MDGECGCWVCVMKEEKIGERGWGARGLSRQLWWAGAGRLIRRARLPLFFDNNNFWVFGVGCLVCLAWVFWVCWIANAGAKAP